MKSFIREYSSSDKEDVINLLRLNTPAHFSPEEEKDFVYYLENEIEHYFIIETEGRIAGCGGFNFADNGSTGIISWDMFHPEFQKKSLGTTLLNHRINKLKEFSDVKQIIVRTSQIAYRFYEKQGFSLTEIKEDFWAKGFHLYKMNYTEEKN